MSFTSSAGVTGAPNLDLVASQVTPLAVDEHVAAAILGVSAMTLRRDRRDGRLGIPFTRIGGRVVYPRVALEQWLMERTRPAPTLAPVAEEPRRRRGRPTKAEQLARQRAAEQEGRG